jgi:predicted acetyltransferase
MMDAQLGDNHERGEPIAALWASEETIYGRFGYGLAAWSGEVHLPREWSAYARPFERRGQVRFLMSEDAATLFPPIWTALMRQRPGVFERTADWWELRRLRMPDEEAANPKRFALLEVEGQPVAYAIYRQFPSWADGSTTARLEVSEVVGANPDAEAEMWRFVLDIDWYATLEASLLPLDSPLLLLLANPRRLKFRVGDSLWVRLVDVGAALSGRAYATDEALVLNVRDAVCPWNEGRWKLEGGTASRTEDRADLVLDVDALGSAYLGAIGFHELRAAGRIEESAQGAVARADRLFSWRPLPWCPEIF